MLSYFNRPECIAIKLSSALQSFLLNSTSKRGNQWHPSIEVTTDLETAAGTLGSGRWWNFSRSRRQILPTTGRPNTGPHSQPAGSIEFIELVSLPPIRFLSPHPNANNPTTYECKTRWLPNSMIDNKNYQYQWGCDSDCDSDSDSNIDCDSDCDSNSDCTVTLSWWHGRCWYGDEEGRTDTWEGESSGMIK